MVPELESCLLQKWSDFALPGERPRELQFLTATRSEESLAQVLLFAFRRGARTPVAVAKVERSPGEARELLREATMLRRLRQRLPPELQGTLPRVLALYQVGGQHALLLEAPEGRPLTQQLARRWLARPDAHVRHAMRIGVDWLCAFQRATRTEAELQPGDLRERHVVAPMRRYRDRLHRGGSGESIDRLCDTVGEALAEAPLFLCCQHGDLRPASVLHHRGRVTIVDWGRTEEHALPLLDPALFITSAPVELAHPRRQAADRVSLFRETWLEPTPLRKVAAGAAVRYASTVGVDPAAVAWGLPLMLAARALRAEEAGPSRAEERHWHTCLRLLADDPRPLACLADDLRSHG